MMSDDSAFLSQHGRIYFKIGRDISTIINIILGKKSQGRMAVFGDVGNIIGNPNIHAIDINRKTGGGKCRFPIYYTLDPNSIFKENDGFGGDLISANCSFC